MNITSQYQQNAGTPNSLGSGALNTQQPTSNTQFNNSQYLFQQQQQQGQTHLGQFNISETFADQLGADPHLQGQVDGMNPSKLLSQASYQGNLRNENSQQSSQQLHSLQQQLQQLQLHQAQQVQLNQQQPHQQQQHQQQHQQQQQQGTFQSAQPTPRLPTQQLLAQQLQSQYSMNNYMTPRAQQTQLAQTLNLGFNEPVYENISVDPAIHASPHWQHQTQLVEVSRQSNNPHFYARQAASFSRRLINGNQEVTGTTLIDVTKNILTSVSKPQELTNTQNGLQGEQNKGVVGTPTLTSAVIAKKTCTQEADAVDEEEEDQRIRIKENNTQLWTGLDLSGQLMTSLTDKVFKYAFLRRLYLNGNNIKEIPKSIASLKSLRVLDLSCNKLGQLPGEMGMLFNLRYLYLFDNDIREIPDHFGNLVSLEFIGIEGNLHMDKDIISLIAKKGTRGLIYHLRDDCIKLPPPPPRNMIEIGEDGEPKMKKEELKSVKEYNLNSVEKNFFTLMSYNTLCQHYATSKMYKYTPTWALNWEYRRNVLTREILSYSTNIICLQEVETRTYEEYWVPLMKEKGYEGVFHCKSRAKTMNEKSAKRVDGCATFYQTSAFELIDKKILEYGKLVISQEKFKKTEDIFNRFMNKDNIASVSILNHIGSGQKLVVANTHLHWDPEYNDVKAMQVAVLLEELQSLVKNYTSGREDINKIPLIICGDFNSQTNSAVYQFISQGVCKDHGDLRDRDYGKYTAEGLEHPFHLRSAYDVIGELPFTNFTPTFTEVIDYIWYSTPTLSVKGLLGGVDAEYTDKVIGFPTADCPSDHIPLLSKFEFKKQASGRRVRADFGNGSRKT